MSRNIPITEFDTLTVNPSMQMLKALVPFLDYPMQRQVSLIIRITELQQTMRFFSNPSSVSGFSSSSAGCAKKIHSIDDIINNEELIDSLLVYCPENYASMIKAFRQFSKMSDLFNAMNLSNEDMGNMFNTFFGGNSDGTTDNGFGASSGSASSSGNDFDNGSGNGFGDGFGNVSGGGFNAAARDNSKGGYTPNDSSNSNNNNNSSNSNNSNSANNNSNNNNSNSANNSNNNNNNNNSNSANNNSSNNNNSGAGNPSGKLPLNFNMGGLGNLLGSAPTNSLLNSFMKPEQQAMYDEYIRQLNNLNFDEPKNNSDTH